MAGRTGHPAHLASGWVCLIYAVRNGQYAIYQAIYLRQSQGGQLAGGAAGLGFDVEIQESR